MSGASSAIGSVHTASISVEEARNVYALAEAVGAGELSCFDLTPEAIASHLELLIKGRAQKIERASQPERCALDPKPPGYIDDSQMYRAVRLLGKAAIFRPSSFRGEHLDHLLALIDEPPVRHAEIALAGAVTALADDRPDLFRRYHLDHLLSVAPLQPELVDDALGILASKRGELWRANDVVSLVPLASDPGMAKVVSDSLESLCGGEDQDSEEGEEDLPALISCSLADTVQEMLRANIVEAPDLLPLLRQLNFKYAADASSYDVDAILAVAEGEEVKALAVLDHIARNPDQTNITTQHVQRIAILAAEYSQAYAVLKTIALHQPHLIPNTTSSLLLDRVPEHRGATEVLKILAEKKEWLPKRYEFPKLFTIARTDPPSAELVRTVAFHAPDFFSSDDLPFLLDPDAPPDFLVIVGMLARDRPRYFNDVGLNRILLRLRSDQDPVVCERLAAIVDELSIREPNRFLSNKRLLRRMGGLVSRQKQLAGTLARLAGTLPAQELPLKREIEAFIKDEIATNVDVAAYFFDEVRRDRKRVSELGPLLKQADPTSSQTVTYYFDRYEESKGVLLSIERRRLEEIVALAGGGSRYAVEKLKPIIRPPTWFYENEKVEPYLRVPPRSFEIMTGEGSDLFDRLLDATAKNHQVLEVVEDAVAVYELLGEGEGIRGRVIDGLVDRALKPADGSDGREAANSLALYVDKNLREIDRTRLERLVQLARERTEIAPGLAKLMKARPEDAPFLAKSLIEAGQASVEGSTCLLMVVIEQPLYFRDPRLVSAMVRYFNKTDESLVVTALVEMAGPVREAFRTSDVFELANMIPKRAMAMMVLCKLARTRPQLFTPDVARTIIKKVEERSDGELLIEEGEGHVDVGADLIAQLITLQPSLQGVVQKSGQSNGSVLDYEQEKDPCPESQTPNPLKYQTDLVTTSLGTQLD